jgi:hypothetical protein
MFKGKPKKTKRGKEVHGKPFTLHHWCAELEHCEKWKNHDVLEVPMRSSKSSMGVATILDEDESSSDDGREAQLQTPLPKPKDLLEGGK